MYEVTEPRTVQDAVAAVLPADADYSMHRLLDAMLALPQFGHPDMPGLTVGDPKRAVFGERDTWTYEKARTVIDHAFGPDGSLRLIECVARYRDQSAAGLDLVFFIRIGLLLRGGWESKTGWDWFRALGHVEMPLDLSAAWLGMWSLDVLNACLDAGLDADGLGAISKAGVLPPPETVAMLGGLRRDPITVQG